MAKCPYDFSLRKRSDIENFLTSIGGYFDRHEYFPLEWDVKAYRFDSSGHGMYKGAFIGEAKVDPKFDEAWEAYCDKHEVFWWCCEDGARQFSEGEYTVYPGVDSKAEFAFRGRSGGHMVLYKWNGYKFGQHHSSEDDFVEYLKELPYKDLRALYKLVVCLNKDVDANRELTFQYNWRRVDWERDQVEEFAVAHPEEIPENYEQGLAI